MILTVKDNVNASSYDKNFKYITLDGKVIGGISRLGIGRWVILDNHDNRLDEASFRTVSSALSRYCKVMLEKDLLKIREFAASPPYIVKRWNLVATDNAKGVHRRNLTDPEWRGTTECQFMREVDNPSPDLVLRGRLRSMLTYTYENVDKKVTEHETENA